MYCSKCGHSMTESQAFCPSCGKAAARPVPHTDIAKSEQQHFKQAMQRLSLLWFLFAALNAGLGLAGSIMLRLGLTAAPGPWEPWPHPPGWQWTMGAGVVWTLLLSRVVVSILAGWGLKEHADWSRPVTLLAAAVSLLQFPMGVALGVYTLGILIGRHHAALYEHWAGAK
jgi:hypothetical protein